MKMVHGSAAELTAAQAGTITELEQQLGEAYVTILDWEAFVTFENGTLNDTVKHVSPEGKIS